GGSPSSQRASRNTTKSSIAGSEKPRLPKAWLPIQRERRHSEGSDWSTRFESLSRQSACSREKAPPMGLWSLDRLRSMLHVDRTDLPVITLFAGILAYVVAYSVLTWLKYESYGMYAWDLGVYDQSMYSTVHYGRL